MNAESTKITYFVPNNRFKQSLFSTWLTLVTNTIKSRELIWQLFKRDFFAVYKKSFFGLTWLFLSPIVGVASWVFLNAAGILQGGNVGVPQPVFVLIGATIWGLFMEFYSASSGTLTAGAGFIMQARYPHEALLFKQIAQSLANFSINLAVNLLVFIFFGILPSWQIVFIPILILPLFFLGSAIGLITSVINVVTPDLGKIINISMSFAFFITPVIYTLASVKEGLLRRLVEINPLTYLIGGVRDIVLFGNLEYPDRYLIAAVATVVLFLFAWRFFYVAEDRIIEKMI